MAPPIFTIRDGAIHFGSRTLFEDINFVIEPLDKICVIGRNGSGKTTLMKMIIGMMEPDHGEVFVKPGTNIGYLPQKVSFAANASVYDHVLQDLNNKNESEHDLKYHADMILGQFDLLGDSKMDSLSGGQQRRADLARILVAKPDVMLLDEPTNHLDIGAIEWLENFINNFRGVVLCISHDRAFLSNVTHKTFWLHMQQILVNKKGFSDFTRWSEDFAERQMATIRKLNKKLETENDWMTYGVTARRKRNIRRLNELKALRVEIRNKKGAVTKASGNIMLPEIKLDKASKLVGEFDGISKSYDDKLIIKKFTSRILMGDRIGIIGNNGSGKSTLVKMIIGRLKPDSGRIRFGKTKILFDQDLTYFDQDRTELDHNETLWECLCPDGGDTIKIGKKFRHVVAYLKDFMFTPEQIRSRISLLSGGEANRLLLAKKLADPGPVMVLDEPTNDLDMDTLDILQEMLDEYKGTLIIVSHDRDFVDRLVTKTIVLEGDGEIIECVGGYSDYLAYKKLYKEQGRNNKDGKTLGKSGNGTGGSKNKNINASSYQDIEVNQGNGIDSTENLEGINSSSGVQQNKKNNVKLSFKHKHALETLPHKIEQLNLDIKAIETALQDAELYTKNAQKFDMLIKDLGLKRTELQNSEELWLESEMLRESLEGEG